MKHVVINVGKDNYGVVSLGDDLKPLSDEWETGIMLAVSMDRMIESGYSKELIANIIDEAYESRL
jgi:hypothetical protein|nr:MAG TPA: hypothetical protein [Caudoviricetes sp.]